MCEALVARIVGDTEAFAPLIAVEFERVKAWTDEALLAHNFDRRSMSRVIRVRRTSGWTH